MSDREKERAVPLVLLQRAGSEVLPAHPSVVAALGEKATWALHEVGCDLASGRIAPENFGMWEISCGSTMCIAGHLAFRLGKYTTHEQWVYFHWLDMHDRELSRLFSYENPSDPQRAANAIAVYVATGDGSAGWAP